MPHKRKNNDMNDFKSYHPAVSLAYFAFIIGFSCFLMHPVCLFISLICAFGFLAVLKGGKSLKITLAYSLMLMLVTAFLNPAFNHAGVTIITYLPDGNPLTLESVIYGISAAAMIVTVICWFSCFNEIMTSDKIICLFGRIMPSLSLVISMTLRFVPRFKAQIKSVSAAQKCMGKYSGDGMIHRAKHGVSVLSAMITRTLENAADTADSMKSRGYGAAGRTSFSIFTFTKNDTKMLLCIIALGVYTLAGSLAGAIDFGYFPAITHAAPATFGVSVFVSYALLCALPVITEISEMRKWKS